MDRLAQARECGYYARMNHRGIESCPTFAIGEAGADERRSWRNGWNQADREERAKYPPESAKKERKRGK
jgi:ribosome modulation factor